MARMGHRIGESPGNDGAKSPNESLQQIGFERWLNDFFARSEKGVYDQYQSGQNALSPNLPENASVGSSPTSGANLQAVEVQRQLQPE